MNDMPLSQYGRVKELNKIQEAFDCVYNESRFKRARIRATVAQDPSLKEIAAVRHAKSKRWDRIAKILFTSWCSLLAFGLIQFILYALHVSFVTDHTIFWQLFFIISIVVSFTLACFAADISNKNENRIQNIDLQNLLELPPIWQDEQAEWDNLNHLCSLLVVHEGSRERLVSIITRLRQQMVEAEQKDLPLSEMYHRNMSYDFYQFIEEASHAHEMNEYELKNLEQTLLRFEQAYITEPVKELVSLSC